MQYDFKTIEARWQQHWQQHQTFATPNPGDETFDPAKPKFYVLDMFPYPSGVGLHVGHPLGYIATDIVARYKRMRGFNVLHPMGFDAFGLPAEQYAIETGIHPRVTTQQNIDNMTRQLRQLGLSYDWQRQIATTDPDYVRWTQWIFLRLWGSYFDPVQNKALPIEQLVAKLQGEDYYLDSDGGLIVSGIDEDLQPLSGTTVGAIKWHELEPDQQRRLLDEYRLAYLDEVEVNWCPQLGTVLANEEVTSDGRSERGNHPVFRRPLKQWMLRITAYADRLIEDLDQVDWPESTKLLQRNWVGRSEGARVDFAVDALTPAGETPIVTVFTTRPDTLFGATYMVLAPEHPLVAEVTTDDHRDAVLAYREQAQHKTAVDRQAEAKEKTGVFTGAYAVNPVNNEKIPVWIADYVMMGYGTGAIMAVPAHDERDHAFAQKFSLPIREVVSSPYDVQQSAYTGDGVGVNSANDEVSLNGLSVADAKRRIIDWLERKALGRSQIQYKLRDWLFSRQRYWGEPFPVLHGPDGEIIAVPEDQLPVELPEMEDYKPVGSDDPDAPPKPPLGRAPESWRVVTIDGKRYERELNTMPQWAGSCWYYLRFCDPGNQERFASKEAERYWMEGEGPTSPQGVDLYVGGVEHAVLHLLYARFWHKVLYDLGHVSTPEPFGKLFNQGYIQAYAYTDARGVYVPAAEVTNKEGKPAAEVQGQPGQEFFWHDQPVTERYGKMGKSLKNAVAPDEICERYGADTLRLYEMYLGPLDQSKPWNTQDIVGVHRFLQRVWRNFVAPDSGDWLVVEQAPEEELLRLLHQTIKAVSDAMEVMAFNVAIAKLIELNNALVSRPSLPRAVAEDFVRMLAPFAPHLAEELWHRLGQDASVSTAAWPEHDEQWLVTESVELPVQVNGKVRGRITVPAETDQATVEQTATSDPKIAEHLAGKTVRKVVIVPGRLVNIVVN
jgi:leucyl-tRNA synthetase